jgi:hypothetical protein
MGVGVRILAEYNGQKFKYNDLVDVIMRTAHGVVGKKCEPLKARFKGVVETVRGPEFCVGLWWGVLVAVALNIRDTVSSN